MIALFDTDFMIYAAACLAEERYILAVHKQSGNKKEFKNKTSFWGNWRTKDGGWLGELNNKRKQEGKEPFSVDDFEVIECQRIKDFGIGVNSFKTAHDTYMHHLGADKYVHYKATSPSWRIASSTLLKYKGNRDDIMRPLIIDELRETIDKKYGIEEVGSGLEVDDVVNIEWWKNHKKGIDSVVVAVDKDARGTGVNLFNPDKMDVPISTSGLGALFTDDKHKVHGQGRKWFYYQVLSGDSSDNYKANCMSDKKWGDKSAYAALSSCKTDKECWQALVDSYKLLYPAPKEVVGWRGYNLTIDWKYVLQENVDMAHMLRFEGDKLDVSSILNKLGVCVD